MPTSPKLKNPNGLVEPVYSIPPLALSWCVFGSLIIFSALSCILGAFYDDEIFSIRWAMLPFPNLIDFIKYINSHDIHPPVAYVLNKLTFDALGNWKAVQFVNGAVNAAAIAWFHSRMVVRVAERERILLTFALATAVTSELWGTGLRWNAYFNPVFLILYTVALSKRSSITARTIVLTLGTIFLFHTSYLSVVAVPVLWGTFVVTSIQELKPILITRVAPIVFAGTVVCLPQLYVLLTVHLPSAWYTGGFQGGAPYWTALLYSIPQSLATLTVGNAVFPIDYTPCLFLLFLAAAAISSATAVIRDADITVMLYGVLLGLVLLVIINLGYEGRNAAFLYPISLTLMVVAIARSAKWIQLSATATLALLQIVSVYNFVLHRDTAKGSYNTPFAQAMEEISSLTGACEGKTYVFTHEPVFTYLVEQTGGTVSSPYAPSSAENLFMREKDCVLIVHTYRGVLPQRLYAEYSKPISSIDFRLVGTTNFGYDRFHAIKTHLGNEVFPEYYVTITAYEVLRNAALPNWDKLYITN